MGAKGRFLLPTRAALGSPHKIVDAYVAEPNMAGPANPSGFSPTVVRPSHVLPLSPETVACRVPSSRFPFSYRITLTLFFTLPCRGTGSSVYRTGYPEPPETNVIL